MEEGRDSLLSHSRAFHAPLLLAALDDDWKSAKAFIQENPNCLTAKITKEEGTALHTAAAAKRTRFVKELVKLMKPEDLELTTRENCTALHFAARSEIVEIAKVMVKKNKNLASKFPKNEIDQSPLFTAITSGHREMVSYLYSVTPIQHLTSADRIFLLEATTLFTDFYDIALNILKTVKFAAPEDHKNQCRSILETLAGKPSEIGSKSRPSVWERCLNSGALGWFCHKAVMQASAHELVNRLWKQFHEDNKYSSSTGVHNHMQLLVEAAKVGNVAFLTILIRSYPDLVWQTDNKNGTLFHVAIKHRQAGVFNLIYEIGGLKDNVAAFYAEGKSMLHLAGELPSTDRLNIISGAALQMQREMLWFQAVEKIVPKSYVNEMNHEGKKPWDIFVETHEELKNNGEKWMKDTANYCMLVATLIATVVFPAAFTVPGGNNQETGIPIFLENIWFVVFFMSDAIAMLFSSSSILVFLSILTARYTAMDFLKSLPRRLALGLATLLISIVGMLIAFSTGCFLVFQSKTSILIRIIVAAPTVPISLFVILHYSLWFDIFCSALCYERFLFRSQNRLFKQAS